MQNMLLEKGRTIDDAYSLQDKIGEGGISTVFKARDIRNNRDVILKILKTSRISSYIEDKIRFKKDIEVISGFDHHNIVKIYGIGEIDNESYAVMELIDGEGLDKIIKSGLPLDVKESVGIIKEIALALNYAHTRGVIHGDLKASNIIIENKTKTVKVADFGFSRIMELKDIKEQEDIIGTFGYMSPEAAGIVNKPLSEASDLYSLGIIIYTLLSGDMPFKGTDVNRILHQQAAAIPKRLSSSKKAVPQVLDAIIFKLLEKEPELRYQSAEGLIYDLERFERNESDFVVGEKDKKIKLNYRAQLIGRDAELRKLKGLFSKSRSGPSQLAIISGDAGMGKSRLADEMRRHIFEEGGYFLTGRCFNQENKIPYQPFKELIDEYIRRTKRKGEEAVRQEKRRIQGSLGELCAALIKLNPNMTQILGQTPRLIPLDPEKENKRFLMVCARYLCGMAEKNQGVVILIDDIQWADEGTINLLLEIMSMKPHGVLIICTCRENEKYADSGVDRIRREAKEQYVAIEEIRLGAFDYIKLNKLAAELLGESEENAKGLSKYLMDRTKGNPFFAIRLIRELAERKFLSWEDGSWRENWLEMEKLPITADIADVILLGIKDLPEGENNLLRIASVIGRTFKLELLYGLVNLEKEKIVDLIDDAVRRQLLEEGPERGTAMFVHDRVRDAFYRNMSDEERQRCHLKIAHAVETRHFDEEDAIFDVVNHYVEGKNRKKVLKYGLSAANAAKARCANESAINYYLILSRILEEENLKGRPEWVQSKDGLLDVYLTVGRNDDAVILGEEILPFKDSPLEKARTYRKIGKAYLNKGNWEECENALAEGLQFLGEKLPREKKELALFLTKEMVIHAFHSVFAPFTAHRNNKAIKTEDEEKIEFYWMLNWMYGLSQLYKFVHSTLRCYHLAHSRIGRKGKALPRGLTSCGSLYMAIPYFKGAMRYHKKAIKISESIKDEEEEAHAYQLAGFCYQWETMFRKALEFHEIAREKFQKIGDMWEMAITTQGFVHDYYFQGDYPRAASCNAHFMEVSKSIKDDYGISASHGWYCHMFTELGDYSKAEKHGLSALEISENKKIWFIACFSLAGLGALELRRGQIDKALKYLQRAEKIDKKNLFLRNYVIHLYTHTADAYIEKYKIQSRHMDEREKRKNTAKISEAVKEALKQAKRWPAHYPGALRASAKFMAILHNDGKAERRFLQSIKRAKAANRIYEEARAHFEYGDFLASINRVERAKYYWQQAFLLFKEIGAQDYAAKCMESLGFLPDKQKNEVSDARDSRERLTLARRFTTLISVTSDISSILDLDELLNRIMDKAIELVGAERGVLFLYPEEDTADRILEIKTTRELTAEEIEEDIFSAIRGIIKKVEGEKSPVIIEDAAADVTLRDDAGVIRHGLKSILCVPILLRNTLMGVIYLDNCMVSGLFTKDDLDIVEMVAKQAGISLENAMLYKKAITDRLTGLYNHSFFEESLRKSVNIAVRYNKKLSLLMIDLDNFKKINDEYGHRAGDLLLMSTADLIMKHIRASDIPARYGGEEFAVILPETDIAGAERAADKIRLLVENNNIAYEFGGKTVNLKITVSIGVAEWRKKEEKTSLIDNADAALYKAKSLGKNRVEAFLN